MEYKSRLLSTAYQDIINIEQYLSGLYPSTALKFSKELDKKILSLCHMPYIGQKYRGYRRLVCGDYLLFYKVKEEEKIVDIYLIIHS